MVGIITSHSGLRPDAKRYVMAGRGVVVDAAGRGDFITIQDACDYMAARGTDKRSRIWVREGIYRENVTIAVNNIVLEGASWDAEIDSTGLAGPGITVAKNSRIVGMHLEAVGGAGDTAHGISISNPATFARIENTWIEDSDDQGIYVNAGYVSIFNCEFFGSDNDTIYVNNGSCRVMNNYMQSSGDDGIDFGPSADGSFAIGNDIWGSTGYAIEIDSGAEYCIVTNNETHGNGVQDDSGTSTVANNNDNYS